MTPMLALTGDGGGGNLYGDRGRARKRATRIMRHREQRTVRRETDAWHRAPAQFDPLDDPSDCTHGCNGDCDRWGSEACTWLCHPEALRDRVEAWAERTGHVNAAGDPDAALVDAHLARWTRS